MIRPDPSLSEAPLRESPSGMLEARFNPLMESALVELFFSGPIGLVTETESSPDSFLQKKMR